MTVRVARFPGTLSPAQAAAHWRQREADAREERADLLARLAELDAQIDSCATLARLVQKDSPAEAAVSSSDHRSPTQTEGDSP